MTPANTPPGQSRGGCGNYYEALGGAGQTGWDWIVNAFTLARLYFPNAKLMLNGYSIVNDRNATERYIGFIKILKARGFGDLHCRRMVRVRYKLARIGELSVQMQYLWPVNVITTSW